MTKAEKYLGLTASEFCREAGWDPSEAVLAAATAAIDMIYRLKLRPRSAHESKRRALNLCVRCGSPAWRSGSSYCDLHRTVDKARKKLPPNSGSNPLLGG